MSASAQSGERVRNPVVSLPGSSQRRRSLSARKFPNNRQATQAIFKLLQETIGDGVVCINCVIYVSKEIYNYSQTCIKRPSIKRSVVKVPKITSLRYCNFELYLAVTSIKVIPLKWDLH